MQFLSYVGFRVKEGLENINSTSKRKAYTDPGLNDNPLYLATLNAANISYLKDQVDELTGLKQTVIALETNVADNSKGIAALGEQFSSTAQELTGRDTDSTEPLPTVTGI
jgi:hypothetical protein